MARCGIIRQPGLETTLTVVGDDGRTRVPKWCPENRTRLSLRAWRSLGRWMSNNSLTPRERDIVQPVVRGKRCKQMAAELGIAEVTLKIHKRNAMEKMGAKSLAEFVIKANALGLCDIESNDSTAYRIPARIGTPSSPNALSPSRR
ncbi:hypothetical protein GCM10027093_39240 [Paraburkholderia jirisanensis]